MVIYCDSEVQILKKQIDEMGLEISQKKVCFPGEMHRVFLGFALMKALMLLMASGAVGFGSMGSISAAFGEHGFFCAIDASGKQQLVCWGKNSSASVSSSIAGLSGGEGFMCGLKAETLQPSCWEEKESGNTNTNLVPLKFQNSSFSQIASGKTHVCAVRGFNFSRTFGSVDCWAFGKNMNNTSLDYEPPTNFPLLGKIVAGDDFTCGLVQTGGVTCWGPSSLQLGLKEIPFSADGFEVLASGRTSVCGIDKGSREIKCWGGIGPAEPPTGTRFVALSAGSHHFCGIREDDHGVECWGSFNMSSIPKGSGFSAIASSNVITCGIQEENLILDCWGDDESDYNPPLQLCSPGLCGSQLCSNGEFSFNASMLSVPDLESLCIRKGHQICSPCASHCSEGFFPSSICEVNADRTCTACSLCQNSSCWEICGFSPCPGSGDFGQRKKPQPIKLVVILGASISGCFVLVFIGYLLALPWLIRARTGRRNRFSLCVGKADEQEADNNTTLQASSTASSGYWMAVTAQDSNRTQAFRLSELKDATNGFKEYNELGRGNYGFVYKAILSDGRQVAVKRANAARRIHSNSRDFEAELEILCKVRHCNLVNLLGYCGEMGERLLVYEFMPHGTLHDHLHGGLSPLSWNLRLKISLHAARGILYLHKDANPHIVHRDIKTSNILLDSDWGARIADFGLVSNGDKALSSPENCVWVDPDYYRTQVFTEKSDVYSFGIVLLEILSGRKAYDKDYTLPDILDWAVPQIKQGKAAAIIDRNVDLPKYVEPLLRLADIAELAVREDPRERPDMSYMTTWLEQITKGGGSL